MIYNTMKIVYVGTVFPSHFGTWGGFHHIVDKLQYDYTVDCQIVLTQRVGSSRQMWARIGRRIKRCVLAVPWYLLKILWLSLTHRHLIFHVIYGEALIDKLFLLCCIHHKVVCTLHIPLKRYDFKVYKYLQYIDKIILVAPDDIDDFEKLTGKKNVTYIPHGVCCNFYRLPKASERVAKDGSILMVGNYLRDFDFANSVFCEILKSNPNQIINVVCAKENHAKFNNAQICCFCGIADEQLRNLYWKSSVLFFPLLDFTANNALLEASACGCNIIIASPKKENSYVPNSMLTMIPLEKKQCVKKLLIAVSNYQYNDLLADYVKNEYSWEIISNKIKEYLKR